MSYHGIDGITFSEICDASSIGYQAHLKEKKDFLYYCILPVLSDSGAGMPSNIILSQDFKTYHEYLSVRYNGEKIKISFMLPQDSGRNLRLSLYIKPEKPVVITNGYDNSGRNEETILHLCEKEEDCKNWLLDVADSRMYSYLTGELYKKFINFKLLKEKRDLISPYLSSAEIVRKAEEREAEKRALAEEQD